MIGTVTILVYGDNFDAIRRKAAEQWREFVGDQGADLPHDTEFRVEEHSEKEYKATVMMRLRTAGK